MTKLNTRNAKNTIIEVVIIVRIVVMHKLPQFEDVNPAVTLWPFLASTDNFAHDHDPRAAFLIAGLSARIHFSNSDLR